MRVIVSVALGLTLLSGTVLLAADQMQDSLAALASEDSSAYSKAVKFLSKNRQQAEPSLVALFHDTGKPELARLRAIKLLGDFGLTAAAGDIQQALKSGSEPNVAIRVQMVRALSKLGGEGAIIEYLNTHKETSPAVNAAIAMSMQGRTDDDSKKALGYLLGIEDSRVFRAAVRAASKTYAPITGQSSNPSNPSPPPPPIEKAPPLSENNTSGKVAPTPGDRAILQALQAHRASTDPQTSQQAAQLLDELSQHYHQ